MKNGILTILGILCVLLILYVFGGFDYGSFIDKDTYGSFSRERQEHVAHAGKWNIGVLSIPDDAISQEALKGSRFAAEIINKQGGISGKPIELTVLDAKPNTPVVHKLITQKLCERKDVAMIIGGLNTSDIPSHRSLTQFHAMPLVSSVAVFSKDLPLLSPDTSMTFYPDISIWTKKLVEKLVEDGRRKIVIISPDDQSYAGIFGVEASKAIHAGDFAESVYTVNYTSPAESAVFYRSLKLMSENRDIDSILFTSTPEELNELTEALSHLNMKVPIYGTDYMDVANLDEVCKTQGIALSYPVVRHPAVAEADFIRQWTEKYGSTPSIWAQLGAQALLTFKNAVEQDNGHYEPAGLIRPMKEILDKQRHSENYKIEIEFIDRQPD